MPFFTLECECCGLQEPEYEVREIQKPRSLKTEVLCQECAGICFECDDGTCGECLLHAHYERMA